MIPGKAARERRPVGHERDGLRRARAAPGQERRPQADDADEGPLAEPSPVGRGQRPVPVVFYRVTRDAPVAPGVGARRRRAGACARAAAGPGKIHVEFDSEREEYAGGICHPRTPRTRWRASRLMRPGLSVDPSFSRARMLLGKLGARAGRPRGPGLRAESACARFAMPNANTRARTTMCTAPSRLQRRRQFCARCRALR